MRRSLMTVLLLGVLSLAISACGGDDDDDGGGGLSKDEYITQADAICKDADEKETEAGAPGPVIEIKQRVLADLVAIDGEAVAQLRQLEAPEGDEEDVEKIVSDVESVHTAREDQLEAARAGDARAEGDALAAFQTASSDLGVSAGSYGLTSCQALGF